MKKHTLNIIASLSIIIFLTSCIKELDNFNLKDSEDKLVLNALVYADSLPKIHVSKSLPSLYSVSKNSYLENAHVQLSQNNNLYFFEHSELGYYYNTTLVPEVNKQYKIIAEYEGFDSVFSAFTIPNKPLEVNIDTNITITSDPDCVGCGENSVFKIDIHLNSNSSTKEYFMVSIISYSKQEFDSIYDADLRKWIVLDESDSILYVDKEYIRSRNPDLKLAIWNNTWIDEVFNDGTFYEGQTLVFEKSVDKTAFDMNVEIGYYYYYEETHLDLEIITIEESYYKYLLYLSRALYAQDDFLAEKVTLFSNVENGLGIISGANVWRTNIY